MSVQPIPKNTALVVIDIQKGFDDPYWGRRCNPEAEANIGRLLEGWRGTSRPVIHTRHMSTNPESPLYPGKAGNEIKDVARPQPGEPVLGKSAHSAFIGTPLESHLRKDGIQAVVVVGINTNHCVSTTARMASDMGFDTYVVSDATATFGAKGPDGRCYSAEEMHAFGLAEIHQEFATIVETESVLQRL